MPLSDEQRRLYKDSLDAGVPESVIAEWDGKLQKDVGDTAAEVRSTMAKTKRKRTTKDGA